MGWRDLVATGDERITLPWVGGRSLYSFSQYFEIQGALPDDHGWYDFAIKGQKASDPRASYPTQEAGTTLSVDVVVGYLVGDHVVPDDSLILLKDSSEIPKLYTKVHLLDSGIDRFSRVRAGRVGFGSPLIYDCLQFPLGPEDAVLDRFLDRGTHVHNIKGVTPALDAAFQLETWQRTRIETARREAEERRVREEAERARQERRERLREQLGDGAGRRAVALEDFPTAATAALAVGGAEFLDARAGTMPREWIVKYRLSGRRFECVCDQGMRIIDSGICLTSEPTGEKGDTYFTLESLPTVVAEAIRTNVLVVYRHA